MQMRIAAAYLLLATGTLWGAGLADYTWFHIQASGDNLNGGGFNPANTGTNYALGRTTKRLTANGDSTDLSVTDAATTSGSTTVTSAGASFTSALAGNVVYLAGGSGALAGSWYEVTAVTNATTITLDRAPPAPSTGATLNIGGSFADLNAIVPLINIASSSRRLTFLVKSGTYTHSAQVNIADPGTRDAGLFRLVGYKTTPFDKPTGTDRPVLKFTSGGGGYGLNSDGNYKVPWGFENVIFDGDGTQTKLVSFGFTDVTTQPTYATNCMLRNTTDNGWTFISGIYPSFVWNRVESTTANAVSYGLIVASYIHDVAGGKALDAQWNALTVVNTVVANIGVDGNSWLGRMGYPLNLIGNTFYHSSTMLEYVPADGRPAEVVNNIFACSTGAVGGNPAGVEAYYGHNAYYANTGGNGNMGGSGDVMLSGSCNAPSLFVDPTNGDYRLNTSGLGAGLVGAGTTAIDQRFGLSAGSPDIGALQMKQIVGGGGGGSYPFLN